MNLNDILNDITLDTFISLIIYGIIGVGLIAIYFVINWKIIEFFAPRPLYEFFIAVPISMYVSYRILKNIWTFIAERL